MPKPKKPAPMKIGKTRHERDAVRPHELKVKKIPRPQKRIFELMGMGQAVVMGRVTFRMQEMKLNQGKLEPVGDVIHGTAPAEAIANNDPNKAQEQLERAMKAAAKQMTVKENLANNALVGHQIIV